jgi:hypothetical protein
MFFISVLFPFSCEEPMPMGDVPRIPVPDPTPSATDALRGQAQPSNGDHDESQPATVTEDISRNELGCGPTRFWAGALEGMETVNISGEIDFNSQQNGSYLVDVVSSDSESVVFGFECSKTGEFSISLPQELGEVWLFGFIDSNADGPSKDDPQGRTEVFKIESAVVNDLTLPIRAGQVVDEAFELKPPGAAGGQREEAAIDPNIETPPPEGVVSPSGEGEMVTNHPEGVEEPNVDPAPLQSDEPSSPESADAEGNESE